MISEESLAKAGISPKAYSELSESERQVVDEVLKEIASGSLDTYDQLYYSDYDEIPVDFLTFITDDRYLGKSTRHGQFLYPFWRNEIPRIFSANVSEVALSGSIGVGKSTAAVLALIYHLYRTMCMKNPQEFFSLAPGTKIEYAFLNNTLGSSYGVAYSAFQAFIQESPWFLKHGKIAGRNYPEYVPEKGFGFVVGSKPQHTLGRAIICLTGDTEVVTSEGTFKIEDLNDRLVKVPCLSDDGSISLSEECCVRKTGEVTELYEVELEDGTIIKCTPDHRLMLKDGTYKMTKDLSEDDELLDISSLNSWGTKE